ncbi:MAG: methionyl-tRNA formyltransferase [Acidobacteria bacterium RIFCSPLOWO2_02_FULL_65_29]|nr:MAG: methionyl-tRNA formyltransferase [Acidobacteria bacterium RIFCSPLOWO2_02_FULL_65_29]
MNGAPLRVVFFGTPSFAVPTLESVLASHHQVVAVVTQPDRPRGRGHKTSDSPVKARAVAAGVPVLQPATLADPAFRLSLGALDADIGVVAAYGRILSEAVLAVPRLGMINVHASLLPRHRGAAPVHRAILAGDTETGVTIMRVVKALDSGPMLAAVRRPIGLDETSEEVERDLARLGAPLLVAALDELAGGTARETPQDEGAATYARRLTKEDGLIHWQSPALRIHNQVRGLHPWPHAHSYLHGARLIVRRTRQLISCSVAPPGEIIVASGDMLRVATAEGGLDLVELQTEGKRPMSARDFLAGHRVRPGDRFTITP